MSPRLPKPLITFPRTASTQDWVRHWARLGAAEGLAVQALEQTAGRGRLQRTWWSPPGAGLYISILLRPAIPLEHASRLTMLVSLAAIDACKSVAGVTPRPKWPNDLLLHGRKLAGVLTELEHQDGRLSYAVIGLGLNVNMDFSDTDLADIAISLRQATGPDIPIDSLRDAYLAALSDRYTRFLAGESPLNEWKAHLEPLGRRVRVQNVGQPDLVGVAVDVHENGALLVQEDSGVVREVWSGDVSCLFIDGNNTD